MPAELDETRHPVVVLRTGSIDNDDAVESLINAFERLFAIGPVGLVIEWGRVGRVARRRIAEYRETHAERFAAAVRCTASVVAEATVDANRAKAAADPTRAARAWYAGTEDEAVRWVASWLEKHPRRAAEGINRV
ncbi:MAG: hypothetical protein AAGA42_18385 [Actinomycetota bacterium]